MHYNGWTPFDYFWPILNSISGAFSTCFYHFLPQKELQTIHSSNPIENLINSFCAQSVEFCSSWTAFPLTILLDAAHWAKFPSKCAILLILTKALMKTFLRFLCKWGGKIALFPVNFTHSAHGKKRESEETACLRRRNATTHFSRRSSLCADFRFVFAYQDVIVIQNRIRMALFVTNFAKNSNLTFLFVHQDLKLADAR